MIGGDGVGQVGKNILAEKEQENKSCTSKHRDKFKEAPLPLGFAK